MPDIERLDAAALSTLRDVLNGDSPHARWLALPELTKKLACMLGGWEASLIETHSHSSCMPQGLSAHCSREISGAQVTHKGDSRNATLYP